HADHFAHLAHPVGQVGDALVGDPDRCERVLHAAAAPRARIAGRPAQHPGLALEQLDAKVLLQIGDAAVHSLLQPLALLLRVVPVRRVGIEAHAIAELAAEHLPAWYPPCFPCQLTAGHLDPAPAARLARGGAKLLDLPEDLVHVAGVLTEDAALEEQRIRLAAA